MPLKKRLMAHAAEILTDSKTLQTKRILQEVQRRVKMQKHVITFYYRVNDPYSHLLVQLLPKLLNQFRVTLKCIAVPPPSAEAASQPELLAEYALKDTIELTRYYPFEFPENAALPTQDAVEQANAILLNIPNTENFLSAAFQVGTAVWKGNQKDLTNLAKRLGAVDVGYLRAQLLKNQNEQKHRGHYLSATLHYGGEWYWGIDRFEWLVERLQKLGVEKSKTSKPLLEKRPASEFPRFNPPGKMDKLPLTLYFSFRSPYSYIALKRAFDLSKQYPVELNIKPVLPMVMRGLPISQAKKMYIVQDAKREADKYNVPFGRIADPVGIGVERCLALFFLAVEKEKREDFLISVTTGIWSEGVDVSIDEGLMHVVERAGLSWESAKVALTDSRWRKEAEQNRQDLFDLGLWGVPSFQLGDYTTWGQDRIWILEEKLKKWNNDSIVKSG